MSDSERNMSEEEDEQIQSDSSSIAEENNAFLQGAPQKLSIQRVYRPIFRKKMIHDVRPMSSATKTIP